MKNQLSAERSLDNLSKTQSMLLNLEGQCKIKTYEFLKIHWAKAVLLVPILLLSFFGALLLIYFKWFRVWIFYQKAAFHQAQYIYIKTDELEQIERIQENTQTGEKNFTFKMLQYKFQEEIPIPIGFQYAKQFQFFTSAQFKQEGMDEQQFEKRAQRYGKNQHLVETPGYFKYIAQVMTKPFFLIQYAISLVFILQSLAVFGILMIVSSFLTTTINYILLYIAYKRIKELAQEKYKVVVIHKGSKRSVQCNQLVPGDVYIPEQKVPCDSLIIQGQIYVNQASLTGESVPIGKFAIKQKSQLSQSSKWLYEGSEIMLKGQNALAVAIHTGYRSKRGQIIRKIMNRNTKDPDFFITLIYFLIETLIVGTSLYLLSLPLLFSIDMETIMIVFRYFDFVGYSFPPPFPIFFNVAYSLCLVRLKRQGVYGTQPQKTVESLNLKTICFDKTGTLTEEQMQVCGVYEFTADGKQPRQILNSSSSSFSKISQRNAMISWIMACCHSVKYIDQQLRGDQIDLKMFQMSGYRLMNDHEKGEQSTFSVTINQNDSQNSSTRLDVLKINQYQSKFQSMSVLVKNPQTQQYFAFVKGAPQKIHLNSTNKKQYFDKTLRDLSLSGYRSIGIGFKEINPSQIQYYFTCSRQQFLCDVNMVGIVAFENNLKPQTVSAISNLKKIDIQPKIITGDNIFIAIQTASRAGIISKDQNVIVLEGAKQESSILKSGFYKAVTLDRSEQNVKEIPISLEISQNYLSDQKNCAVAVDNDFLMLDDPPFLADQIKIYSRISPENKALIIRKLKEQIQSEYDSRSKVDQFFGSCRKKIGMVGDGANDLIAIKEADVGMGFSNTDASYAASFTIQNLQQIDLLIRQSKNVTSIVIQMVQYYGLTNILKIGVTILLTFDSTYFTSSQLIYYNFTSTLVITNLMTLTRPVSHTAASKHSPCQNFMGLQNHLIYWGHSIIWCCGIIVGYLYYKQTPDFSPNPNSIITFESGYYGKTHSTTIVYLMLVWSFVLVPFIVYRSEPWKQRIYKNYTMTLVIVLNVFALLFFYFSTENEWLGFVEIAKKQAVIVLGIMMGTVLVSMLFQIFVERLQLHKRDSDDLDDSDDSDI